MTTQAPGRQLTGEGEGVQIRLLRAGKDVVELSPSQLAGLKKSDDTLVWLDATVSDGGIEELTEVLGTLYDDAASLVPLLKTTSSPGVEDRDDLLRVEVVGLDADHDFEARDVICIVSEGWVVTTHETNVQFVDEFSKALEGPSEAGALDAPAFLAVLLGWQIQSYRDAVDDVIRQIDKLDDELLKPGWNGEKLIVPMVQIRRRISRLRRMLAPIVPYTTGSQARSSTGSRRRSRPHRSRNLLRKRRPSPRRCRTRARCCSARSRSSTRRRRSEPTTS